MAEARVEDDEGEQPPKAEYIQENLPELFRHYKERNKYYDEAWKHANGKNEIEKPKVDNYEVKTLHMWFVRSYLNERLARFLQTPHYRFIPTGLEPEARSQASYLEKSINALMYWTRRSLDDFENVLSDVLLVDGGAMALEANMKAAYPRLTNYDEYGDDDITRGMPTGQRGEEEGDDALSDDEIDARVKNANKARENAREEYKKNQGEDGLKKLFTNRHVPYNAYFPFPDSDIDEEVCELEFRSIRKVVKNERFDAAVRGELRALAGKQGSDSFRQQVPIIRYCNENIYAYYVAFDIEQADIEGDDSLITRYVNKGTVGEVKLLYWYAHNAGRPLYTHFRGMHGGWAGDVAAVKGKVDALLAINTAIDELCSQAFSNVRETFWPTLLFKLNMERPDSPLNDGDAKKITHRGTSDVYLFENEDVAPMFQPRDNPIFNNLMERLTEAMAKIGGAPGLYGVHQSGVEGGYQENTLLQQADSQFARIENNIVTSAQDHLFVLLSLIRAMGEKIPVRVKGRQQGTDVAEDLIIDPKDLNPMPMVDAVVKAKNPGDMANNINNFLKATADQNGPGTASMPRERAAEVFLQDEQPDDTDILLKTQAIMDMLWPQVAEPAILKRLSLMTAQQAIAEAPPFNPDPMANDPELAAQAAMFATGQMPPDPMMDPMGGMAPAAPMPGVPNLAGTQGLGGGLPPGSPQPEQTMGRTEQVMAMPVGPV